jgi:hypothetical protein
MREDIVPQPRAQMEIRDDERRHGGSR